MFDLAFGTKVKDKCTGIEGVITGKATYLYESSQYRVEYKSTDGLLCTSWLEPTRLEVVEEVGKRASY